MFLSPLYNWAGEYRRRQCVHSVYPSIQRLVEKAYLAGWSREEILIAIADAADSQLSEVTENTRPALIDIVDPLADTPDEPTQKRLPPERSSSVRPR